MTPRNDLPDALVPDSIGLLKQVDSVCDAFEESWKSGVRPSLERVLREASEPTAALFLELVQIDLDYRRRRGESPRLDEYKANFPDYEAALSSLDPGTNVAVETVNVPPPPPLRLGRFEIVRQLGAGSFGVVWQARDPHDGEWVAIKELREGIVPGHRPVLEREARALAKLDHPNVVRVLELGEGAGTSEFLVFEFIDGENLKHWLEVRKGAAIEPHIAADLVRQIAEGLEHIHGQVIVHRDIKPANILLTKAGVPKIADFGLARHMDAASTISSPQWLMGTVPYMSPEQSRAWSVDATTDIYSLGVILYELLAGRRPFDGTENETIQQIRHRDAPPFDPALKVPAPLEAICRRMLEKAPADRYRTARDVAADLNRFLQGERLAPKPFPYRRITRTLVNRRSFIAASLGVPALAMAGFQFVDSRRPPEDGSMAVRLTTKPEGARLSFFPLSDTDGRPIPDRVIDAGPSPVARRLAPGDYLVVADLGDGRFHEVYRHVPANPKTFVGPFRHQRWKVEGSEIVLPAIQIPERSVTDGMALVDEANDFSLPKHGNESLLPCDIPAFFVDTQEFTIGEYKRLMLEIVGPDDPIASQPQFLPASGDDRPKTVSFDEALARAEAVGKRLLHDWEFELIVTARGKSRYPWGTDLPERDLENPDPTPVRTPEFDRFVSNGVPIYGLGSNVAEWVDGVTFGAPKLHSPTGLPLNPAQEVRAVRGGNFEVFRSTSDDKLKTPNPRQRSLVSRYSVHPGIGFRCARSARPRLTPEDFVRRAPRKDDEPPSP